MSITVERAWEILKERGIETKEELKKELEKNSIEIGMFTMPVSKDIKRDA